MAGIAAKQWLATAGMALMGTTASAQVDTVRMPKWDVNVSGALINVRASDIYLFRGKVAITNKIGASALVRIGLTYDRLWKPRYQPFF